ncbi:MAG: LysR family transcriptional regulator [Burkholderiaceae bacterium]|nr:LysR family transcriptional regulator [Burkholderiaceae bacterium]MEB2350633.1 LysR family transcriptional regulator [Burkholderiaceae bacterium]
MRLRHVEILYAIKKTGSISAAAEALSITQPAASKVLKHAEQRLGFPLFRRSRGRVYPTDEAELLLVEVEKVFAALERTRDTARILRQRLDTRLMVACLPSLGFSVVPRAVQSFRKRHPGTMIEIGARHSSEIINCLLAREFDLGIGFGPEAGECAPIGIEATLLAVGRMMYVDHPSGGAAAAGGTVRLRDIDERRLIGLNTGHHLGTSLNRALTEHGLTGVPGIQVQTYYIALGLVAAGSGCAVIDEFTAGAGSYDVVVRAIEPVIRFGVYAYTRGPRPPDGRMLEFLECLRTTCLDNHIADDRTAARRPAQ